MSTKIIESIILDGGKVQGGVFLQTAEDIISDQVSWGDADGSKNADFTTSGYWITTDDGQDPIGIDTDEELKDVCPDSDYSTHEE